MKDFIYTGSFTGTTDLASSGLHVRCGFVPRRVMVRGRTSGNSVEWIDSMPAASKYTSDDTSSNTGFAYSTTNGITPIDGSDALAADAYLLPGTTTVATGKKKIQGFFLAAACITNTEVYDIIAER